MPYPFDQIFAADPDNTEMVASNVGVLIFAPGDETKTPLQLTTLTGIPLANPVPVNDKGFGAAFMADLDQVAWEGGGFTGLFASYKGMKDEAVAAREAAHGAQSAAEEAARNSAAPTQEAVASALSTEGPARDTLDALVGSAVTSGTAGLAVKPDNGGKPVGKGELVLNAKDFGAIGDGVADDQPALEAAITAAAPLGATVLLEPGKTYRVSSPLIVSNKHVSLATWGQNAVIQAPPGQQFDILTIAANLNVTTKTLAASMTIGTNGWVLNNAAGVTPGMLVAVKSSASWYYEPRPESTDTRKSELHRVTAVEGNTIWTEDPSNDGYDAVAERVELIFFNPIRVHLENITVRGVKPAYAMGAPAKCGIIIRGAYEPRLINVNVEQATYLGISLVWSYMGAIIGGHTHSANARPTGYGVQTDGCAHTRVIGRAFWECRRGIDFSGSNIISRHSLAENCVQMGGGRQDDGQYYGWGPNNSVGIQNFGFGSHGAADHSTYRNNRTSNCQIPYSLRGANEIIDGAYHVGRTRGGFINLITGSGLTARNIKLRAANTGGGKNAVIYDGGGNIATRRPDSFLQIDSTYDVSNGRIFVENVDAEVIDRFVAMQSGAIPASFFHMGGVRVAFATSSGSAECAVLWHDGPLAPATFRWAIGLIDYRRDGGTGSVTLTKNLNLNGIRVLDYPTSGPTA